MKLKSDILQRELYEVKKEKKVKSYIIQEYILNKDKDLTFRPKLETRIPIK